MNVTLISFDEELYCLGIRILSAALRSVGHSSKCVFLPPRQSSSGRVHKFRAIYPESLLEQTYMLCAEDGLIGMSLMSNQFIQAQNVTRYLKKRGVKAPIIWGGIHPTVDPESCLQDADMVCLGEGEDALPELIKRIELGGLFQDTKNIWLRANGAVSKNALRPLLEDLDSLPLPDYSFQDHYYCIGQKLEALTREKLIRFKGERFRSFHNKIAYPVMTSRGCLFACSYCCNSVFERLYGQQKRLRFRSAENVICELRMIEEKVAPLDAVIMVDDNFTARPVHALRRFCEVYMKEIGAPFYCQVSPLTINEEKLDILIEHGCVKVTMGVETANERIAALYNRSHFHKVLSSSIALIERYRPKMKLPPTYQFIIDNPYETPAETIETLKLSMELKKPWDNPIYSLMLFPGTPLFQKAKDDGMVGDLYQQVYGRNWLDHSNPYLRLWAKLYRLNAPRWFLRFLLRPRLIRFLAGRKVQEEKNK